MAKKKNKSLLFPKIILGVFVVYAVITLISLQVDIHAQKKQVTVLEAEVEQERVKKEQLTQLIGDEPDEEYIVSEAQKNGYAAPNERVFRDVAGQ